MNRKQRPQKKSYNWIVTTVLAGCSLGYVFGVFVPRHDAIAEMQQQTREMQLYIVQAARLQTAIRETEAKRDKTAGFVKQWKSHAPATGHLGALFGRVTSEAKEVGVRVNHFTPQSSQPLETMELVPVAMNIEGSLNQILRFLAKVERLESSIWVDELRLEPSENRETVRCELVLTVFSDNTDFSG